MDAESALEKAVDTVSCNREESFFDGLEWVGYRTYVKLVRENSDCHTPYQIGSPADVYRAFAKLSECDRERFYAVHLDSQTRVCGVELVSQGTINCSLVTPREVYKSAILANASGLILVHNHPSGIPSPSTDDRSITEMIRDSGRVVDIPVYDHVIIGDKTYFSFSEAGLL